MEKPVSKSHQGQQSQKALQQSPDVRVQSLPSDRRELRAWHRGRPCTRGDPVLTVLRSAHCGWLPAMRQQLRDATGRLVGRRSRTSLRYAHGSCPLSFVDWIKLMMAAARWPARSEPANSQLDLPMRWCGCGFPPIVVRWQITVIDVARERLPALQAVVDSPGCGRTIRHPLPLPGEPLLQGISHLAGLLLPRQTCLFIHSFSMEAMFPGVKRAIHRHRGGSRKPEAGRRGRRRRERRAEGGGQNVFTLSFLTTHVHGQRAAP